MLDAGYVTRHIRRRYWTQLTTEQQLREEILKSGLLLQQAGDAQMRSEGHGQVAIVADGSFASAQLPYMLQGFQRANASGFVGGVYLLEPDKGREDMSLSQIPVDFTPNLTRSNLYLFPGGMSGKSVREILAIRHLWEQEVRTGSDLWIKYIKANTKPAVLLVFISSGGSAGLAKSPVQAFRKSFPTVPIYLVTILDEKSITRAHWPEIRAHYSDAGLITKFIVEDNRRNPRASDVGNSLFFPGMAVAPWLKPTSVDLWNLGPVVFPNTNATSDGQIDTRFATLAVSAEYLPVKHRPAVKKAFGDMYWAEARLVEDIAMRQIQAVVENEALRSLPLPTAQKGTTRVVLLVTPVTAPTFMPSIARIDEGLEHWRQQTDVDLNICYASIKAQLDPMTEQVPIVAILLEPLAATPEDVDQLATGALPVEQRFLLTEGTV